MKKLFWLALIGCCACASPRAQSRIRDLEMENAALRTANEYLLDARLSPKEKQSLLKGLRIK